LELVRLLLDRGADLHAANVDGWNALHRASLIGETQTIQLLLDRGAHIEAVNNVRGRIEREGGDGDC